MKSNNRYRVRRVSAIVQHEMQAICVECGLLFHLQTPEIVFRNHYRDNHPERYKQFTDILELERLIRL